MSSSRLDWSWWSKPDRAKDAKQLCVTTKHYGRRETIVRKTERRGKAKVEFVENVDRNATRKTTLKRNYIQQCDNNLFMQQYHRRWESRPGTNCLRWERMKCVTTKRYVRGRTIKTRILERWKLWQQEIFKKEGTALCPKSISKLTWLRAMLPGQCSSCS